MAESLVAEAPFPGGADVLPHSPRVNQGCELAGYEALQEEQSYWIEDSKVQGQVPADIAGTFYLSCVGRNKVGDQQFGHWFDGDGMINAMTVRDGKVHFNNRYVRTPKFVNESEARRILYRGVGTQIPGGMWRNMFRAPGNAANTSVVLHAGKLLALWEGGKPFELDPATLETVGEYNFEGELSRTQPFSAHPRFDPRTGNLYNFGVFGVPKPKLHFYCIDPDGRMVMNRSQYIGDYSMCHDFVITDRHAVFVLCPAFMRRPFRFLFGMNSIFECIDFEKDEKTKMLVLDLATADIVQEYEFDSFFGFHLGNGHESGDEISLDVLCVDDMDVMGGLSDVFMERDNDFDFQANGARLDRFCLNVKTGGATRSGIAGSVPGEFPEWHGDLTGVKNRYTWLGTIVENGTPYGFNAYQKIDNQTGELRLHDFGEGRFTSEASFIPKKGAADEDDGYLISIVYNDARKKSEIVIVDAKGMQDELAVLPLETHIPFGFHGNYYDQVFR